MLCEYCQRSFSSFSSLTKHQHTAKYCIQLQKAKGLNPNAHLFPCTFCNKTLTSLDNLHYHQRICKNKPEQTEDVSIPTLDTEPEHDPVIQPVVVKVTEDVRLLQETIRKLQQQVEDLAVRPTSTTTNNHTTNNHTTNNTVNHNHISIINYMNEEHVLDIFRKHFNTNDLPEKNLADFTYKWFLKGNDKPVYLCTDPTRKRFVFINPEGKEVVDKNCSTLISLLYQAQPYIKDLVQDEIIDQTDDVIQSLRSQYHSFLNLEKDGTEYKLELCRRLPQSSPIETTFSSGIKDDIDWAINKKNETPEPIQDDYDPANDHDPFGMFS